MIGHDHSDDELGGGGGGMLNEGTTTLKDTALFDDTTTSKGFGGASSNFGPLNIEGGEIGPHDEAGEAGGGVYSTQP